MSPQADIFGQIFPDKMLRDLPTISSDSRVTQTMKLEEQGYSGENRELEVLDFL